mmetsp:Transcript_125976/g.204667  ORF Transcript_125976/g.204667 Transcript_125976/m.204667 type:complete len:290 (-) Transcript_125976:57-926(-)
MCQGRGPAPSEPCNQRAMVTTQVLDIDEERLLRHFCLEEECTQVLDWLQKEGISRPEEFEGRMSMATNLREQGNARYQASDFQGAMMYALGALHALDFNQAKQFLQTDKQKQEVNEALLPLLSNLSIVFLKRGDAYNSTRAADLGLDRAKKLPASEFEQLRAKLLFRRGLAKGQTRDFTDALENLREAAKLMPTNRDVRRALDNCKVAIQRERGKPDDRWRGLLTDTPNTAQFQARTSRCWKRCRQGAHEAREALRKPENLKVVAMIVLGPVLSTAVPLLVMRWVTGKK